jgi:hypothetical protein
MVAVSAKKVFKKFHACVPLTSETRLTMGNLGGRKIAPD